jgi:hypothetical protein
MNTEDYIAECAAKGIRNIKAICDHIETEMREINERLKEFDALRLRYSELSQILSTLDETRRRPTSQEQNPASPEAIALKEKIVDLLDGNDFPGFTNREIISAVGTVAEDSKVILALKWLTEHGILSRDESSERKYAPGPRWGTDWRKEL